MQRVWQRKLYKTKGGILSAENEAAVSGHGGV